MVSKETSERVQLCQRYFDDMLARAHSANDDLQEASRKLTDALKAWEREFFSCDEPKKRARIADSEPDNRKGHFTNRLPFFRYRRETMRQGTR